MAEHTTKITIKNEFCTYSVEVNKTGMDINEIKEELLIPLLISAGYSHETIKQIMKE